MFLKKKTSSNLEQLEAQFLKPSGWLRSRDTQTPQTNSGDIVPWFTYGAIEFLRLVVRESDNVFEFGSGYSTLWWEKKANSVHSVEHDPAWYEHIKSKVQQSTVLENLEIDAVPVAANAGEILDEFNSLERRTDWPNYDEAKVIRRGLEDTRFAAYASSVSGSGQLFDIIIIDGMARRLCTHFALKHLAKDGIIILDNSNRSDYDLAYQLLEEAGMKKIPFWGLVPGANFMTCTTIYLSSLSRLPSASFAENSMKLPEY